MPEVMHKHKCVMLVDEDDIDNIINQKIMESNNFSEKILVLQAGADALNYLAEHGDNPDELPEIIFLDINMPIMDGFQFLEEFEELKKPLVHEKCKVIMLSSSISPKDIDRAASNRFVKKYLNKPLNTRYLDAINL